MYDWSCYLQQFQVVRKRSLYSSMPQYSIQEFNEPNFMQYESYYLTWQDDGYGNGGPYGEPISAYQDDLFYEPSSPAYPELVDFAGRFWNDYGLTDQVYKELQLQLPYSGTDNNWLGEYESYFDGNWKEDVFSYKDGAFEYENGWYGDTWKKAEDMYPSEEQNVGHYSYDDDREERSPYDYKFWFGTGFALGYGDEEEGAREYEPFHRENDPLRGWSMYEMRLCEGIFGNWPPLSAANNESSVIEAHA